MRVKWICRATSLSSSSSAASRHSTTLSGSLGAEGSGECTRSRERRVWRRGCGRPGPLTHWAAWQPRTRRRWWCADSAPCWALLPGHLPPCPSCRRTGREWVSRVPGRGRGSGPRVRRHTYLSVFCSAAENSSKVILQVRILHAARGLLLPPQCAALALRSLPPARFARLSNRRWRDDRTAASGPLEDKGPDSRVMGLPLSQPRPASFAFHAAIGLCKLADFDTQASAPPAEEEWSGSGRSYAGVKPTGWEWCRNRVGGVLSQPGELVEPSGAEGFAGVQVSSARTGTACLLFF